MAKNINDRILQLQVDTKKLKIQIEELNKEGKTSQQIFDKLSGEFEKLVDSSIKLADSSKRSFGQKKDLEEYKSRLTKINTALTGIGSSYKSLDRIIQQSNDEQMNAFKRLESLQEEVTLRQIQLSKKSNEFKLRDIIAYYERVQQKYAQDSEEYLKYEKKKLDAQIRLEKDIEDRRVRSRKAAVEDAVKTQKDEEKRRADVQERWDKRKRDRATDAFKKLEKEKTQIALQEQKKREAEERKRDFGGGFRAQLTPRAIGGALGSLSKYLGLYQAINAAQRLFSELTIGSLKQAINFEKALGTLSATAAVSGDRLEMLSKNALEVAGQTKFTAEEIVGLQTELSKLGFSAEEVVASTQSIAFAAQALGSPLESTAALIGKVRNQFGLLIEQTTEIADTLVTSINKSALSFESFGTAMQYVGPIANNLGLSLKQTVGAMASLADAGFTASRIGTGLRGIFTELGKTSADVEQSLKDLADQNISLSEAVDLVGKRNAAQLITLLKNIDAIDESNDKYYQQGRALFAAAEQANTFNGQLEILNSEFQKFRINIGNNIVQSEFFIRVLGLLSTEAQRTAYGFKILSEIGFEKYSEDVDRAVEGTDQWRIALITLNKNNEITSNQYRKLARDLSNLSRQGKDFNDVLAALKNAAPAAYGEARDKLVAYLNVLNQGVESQKQQNAITQGQEIITKRYNDSVDKLIKSARQGNNVNDEANELSKQMERVMDSYSKALKNNTNLSEERRLSYESSISTLQRYQEQLTNVILSEQRLREIFEQTRNKALRDEANNLKERIRIINEETAERIANLNERAEQETAIAETAEERADIEAERQKLVSDAYAEAAYQIGELNVKYEENRNIVDSAVKSNEKLAEVLGSEVINDLNKAFKEYSDELSSLQEALKDGKISQEDYETSVAELRARLVTTISTFKEMFGTTPQLEQFFNNLLINFDALTYKAIEADDKVKKVHKTVEDFFKDFAKGDYLDYVSKAFDALGESLDEFNDTAAENTKNSLESQLDSIKNRYEVESQILKSQLDNQLITESQFRQKQNELRKAQLAEENTINRQIFNADKKQDVNSAKIEGLEAAAKAIIDIVKENAGNPIAIGILSALSTGIIATQTTAQITAINQRKFFEKKFADGGIVNGPSHDQGGVPFTVQGQGGYEMEGGEFVVNKRATSMHRDLLERINNSYRTRPTVGSLKFAEGGLVPSNPMAESVDYLKAIAEATTSTAIGVSRPVRAYVADKDLRSNATERRIRDRNDRL